MLLEILSEAKNHQSVLIRQRRIVRKGKEKNSYDERIAHINEYHQGIMKDLHQQQISSGTRNWTGRRTNRKRKNPKSKVKHCY